MAEERAPFRARPGWEEEWRRLEEAGIIPRTEEGIRLVSERIKELADTSGMALSRLSEYSKVMKALPVEVLDTLNERIGAQFESVQELNKALTEMPLEEAKMLYKEVLDSADEFYSSAREQQAQMYTDALKCVTETLDKEQLRTQQSKEWLDWLAKKMVPVYLAGSEAAEEAGAVAEKSFYSQTQAVKTLDALNTGMAENMRENIIRNVAGYEVLEGQVAEILERQRETAEMQKFRFRLIDEELDRKGMLYKTDQKIAAQTGILAQVSEKLNETVTDGGRAFEWMGYKGKEAVKYYQAALDAYKELPGEEGGWLQQRAENIRLFKRLMEPVRVPSVREMLAFGEKVAIAATRARKAGVEPFPDIEATTAKVSDATKKTYQYVYTIDQYTKAAKEGGVSLEDLMKVQQSMNVALDVAVDALQKEQAAAKASPIIWRYSADQYKRAAEVTGVSVEEFTATQQQFNLRMAKAIGQFRSVTPEILRFATEIDKGISPIDKWTRRLTKAGWGVGFFGWIVSYAGRSVITMFRQMWDALGSVLQVSVGWTDTLGEMATSIGLLQAAGFGLFETEELLAEGMDVLIESGLKVQALWSGITDVFKFMAVVFGEAMIPYLEVFLQRLTELAAREDFKAFIRDVAEFIGTRLLPVVVDIIQSFKDWWPVIEPVAAAFVGLMKIMAPFAPILITLGAVLWMLGPAITAIGIALSLVNVLMVAYAIASGTVAVATASQAASLSVLNSFLIAKVGSLIAAKIAMIVHTAATVAATVAQWAYNAALAVFHALSGPVGWAILAVAAAVGVGTVAWLAMTKNLENANKATEETTKSQRELAGAMDDIYGHSISDIVERDINRVIKAYRRVGEAAGEARGELGFEGGGFRTQYMTVYTTIDIGSVTGVTDLEAIAEKVDRGIATGLRRRVR